MPQPVDEILHTCGAFLSSYRAIICDVWGVLHDGVKAYEESNTTLTHYRAQGGRVVLLSNSPQISSQIVDLLERKGVWRSVYDDVVTSGDVTIKLLRQLDLKRVYHIGPDRHDRLYEGQPYVRTPLDKAEALVCTGFFNDAYEDMDSYAPLLEQAQARGLPFICANPDLIVDVGGVLYPCAGAIAQLYEDMGGIVHWAGKPFDLAFQMAREKLSAVCRAPLEAKDILVIGDTLRTDIEGAAKMGFDALFIAQGIHRLDVAPAGEIDRAALIELYKQGKIKAKAAAFSLR